MRRRGWLDAAFEMVDRDLEVGGGIIAGALAYRLFIWLLPAGLVFVGGIGVVADVLSDTPKHIGSQPRDRQHRLELAAERVALPFRLVRADRRRAAAALRDAERPPRSDRNAPPRLGDVRDARPKPTYVDAAKLLGILIAFFVLAGACRAGHVRTRPGRD